MEIGCAPQQSLEIEPERMPFVGGKARPDRAHGVGHAALAAEQVIGK
jgi:hypothetical protein